MTLTLVQVWVGDRCRPPTFANHWPPYVQAHIELRGGDVLPVWLTHQPVTRLHDPADIARLNGRRSAGPSDQHLRMELGALRQHPQFAPDVVVCRVASGARLGDRLSELRRRTLGCLVMAVPTGDRSGGWVIDVKGQSTITVFPHREGARMACAMSMYASMVHTWTVLGHPLAALAYGRLHIARTAASLSCEDRTFHYYYGNS